MKLAAKIAAVLVVMILCGLAIDAAWEHYRERMQMTVTEKQNVR
ncbi:MAG: hypothetical protein AAF950_18270 [Pseudomonadota bacterium]